MSYIGHDHVYLRGGCPDNNEIIDTILREQQQQQQQNLVDHHHKASISNKLILDKIDEFQIQTLKRLRQEHFLDSSSSSSSSSLTMMQLIIRNVSSTRKLFKYILNPHHDTLKSLSLEFIDHPKGNETKDVITNHFWQSLVKYCPQSLQELHIQGGCSPLSLSSLDNYLSCFPMLQSLTLEHVQLVVYTSKCHTADDSNKMNKNNQNTSSPLYYYDLPTLQRLQCLDIKKVTSLNDSQLSKIVQTVLSGNVIQSLAINLSCLSCQETIQTLSKYLPKCKTIKSLDINKRGGDSSITHLLRLRQQQQQQQSKIPFVDYRPLFCLSNPCCSLQQLDLSKLSLTDQDVLLFDLKNSFPNLQVLNLAHNELSNSSIQFLARELKNNDDNNYHTTKIPPVQQKRQRQQQQSKLQAIYFDNNPYINDSGWNYMLQTLQDGNNTTLLALSCCDPHDNDSFSHLYNDAPPPKVEMYLHFNKYKIRQALQDLHFNTTKQENHKTIIPLSLWPILIHQMTKTTNNTGYGMNHGKDCTSCSTLFYLLREGLPLLTK